MFVFSLFLVPCLKLLNSRILSSMVLLGALIGEEVTLSLTDPFRSSPSYLLLPIFLLPPASSLLFSSFSFAPFSIHFSFPPPSSPSYLFILLFFAPHSSLLFFLLFLLLLLHPFLFPPPLSQSSSDCQDRECQLS